MSVVRIYKFQLKKFLYLFLQIMMYVEIYLHLMKGLYSLLVVERSMVGHE